MPNLVPWTERTFHFDSPVGLYPELIERLRGAPLRAEAIAAETTQNVLVRRDGETWSIQENIAHLADNDEATFIPRLDQYDRNERQLKPADMANRATWGAHHNDLPIGAVLDRFRVMRLSIIERLESQDESYFARSGLHPRLQQPMRVIDLLLFKAEHDDYHFARMRELLRMFTGADGRPMNTDERRHE